MTLTLQQRQRLIVTALLALGALSVAGMWAFEAWAGMVSPMDHYAYPVLMLLLCGSLAVVFLAPAYRHHAEYMAYAGVCLYFLSAVFSFSIFQSKNQVYTIANTLQWMPIVYVAAFVMFHRRAAVLATLTVFLTSLVPSIAILAVKGASYWDETVAALLVNAYAAHLLTLVALSLFATLSDEFERASSKARSMESAALTDNLTGVANRRGIDAVLDGIDRGDHGAVGLVLIDVDHFKGINDRFGHFMGDDLLVYIAKNIGAQLRDTDMLGRWGGEEFVVVAPGASQAGVFQLAERIRLGLMNAPHPLAGQVTLSAGVTLWTRDTTVKDALATADRALYRAKSMGRNRVESG